MGPSYDTSTLKPLTALIALEVVVAHYPNLIDISCPTHRTLSIRHVAHVDSPFAKRH